MTTLLCNCNQTLPLDLKALQAALPDLAGQLPQAQPYTALCRREAPQFQKALKATAESGQELLVACTQESRLFLELNEQTEGSRPLDERPIRFFNLRELAAWSAEGEQAAPKQAALIASAQLPLPAAVETVSYQSTGKCLVVGPTDLALQAADLLGPDMAVTVLALPNSGALPQRRVQEAHVGVLTGLTGRLGAFKANWQSANPIDLDLCTRCNACIAACPEGAIDFSYSVDLSRCRSHRDCVAACDAVGAINFDRPAADNELDLDLVLDLRPQAAFERHAPPQGYFHVPVGPTMQALSAQAYEAILQMRGLVGTFDKPKFFKYRAKLCAHSRNEQPGCTACIDVCSAQAIRSDAKLKGKTFGQHRAMSPVAPTAGGQGGGIVVDPHLCVGCGACTTVCPTGAIQYTLPNAVDQGRRIRTLLETYRRAGGRDAVLLIHSEGAGLQRLEALARGYAAQRAQGAQGAGWFGSDNAGRAGPLAFLKRWNATTTDARAEGAAADNSRTALRGLPARVLPLAVWHTASIGLELWLTAIAQGAQQVWVMTTDEEAPQYLAALRQQMAVAEAVLQGLGYRGEHFRCVDAADLPTLDAALRVPAAQGVAQAMSASVLPDKRPSLDAALEHLLAHSPQQRSDASQTAESVPQAIALPTGSPWGSLEVDGGKCTMCLSCVGACPASALADNPDAPQLRFTERNCVQCGLCATTCPEDAIQLVPRLLLAEQGKARKTQRVLHAVKPFACIRCSKPFGTQPGVEAMIAKIGHHAAFAGAAADRLRMCGDCRVADMFSAQNETRIQDIR